MELYEEEQDWIPMDCGIATLPLLDYQGLDHQAALQCTQEAVAAVLARNQFPFTLGGEHSLTPACVRAAQQVYPRLGVISFDAHSDLRAEYEGSPLSHASALRRTLDVPGVRVLEIGIRSSSPEEIAFIRQEQPPVQIIWAHQLATFDLDTVLAALPEAVYVTVDLDCFDPGIMPAVGTPEPGGVDWATFLRQFRHIVQQKTVVACDVVELCPLPGYIAADFLAAKLVYKMLGSILKKATERKEADELSTLSQT